MTPVRFVSTPDCLSQPRRGNSHFAVLGRAKAGYKSGMLASAIKNSDWVRNASVLGSLHKLARPVVERSGFKIEIRRKGDLKLALVRKKWTSQKKKNPKRLVVIPGLGDTPMSWLGVFSLVWPGLDREYDEIVFFNLPGFHGFLSSEKAIPSMDLALQFSQEVLESLRPHTVFGHSLGGWLAGAFATGDWKYGGPQKTILVGPSGVLDNQQKQDEWTERFVKTREVGFDAYRPLLCVKEPLWFPLIVPDMHRFFKREDVLEFMHSFREDHLLNESLKNIKHEFWVLWGEHDRIVPSEWAVDWTARVPGGQGLILKNIGHSPQIENPIVASAALQKLLGSSSNRIYQKIEEKHFDVV